jgi:hypothetical protein
MHSGPGAHLQRPRNPQSDDDTVAEVSRHCNISETENETGSGNSEMCGDGNGNQIAKDHWIEIVDDSKD